ncbi:uncharacterized protein C630.12 isoform X2 [Manihot esculenta]|uniref:Calcineurin-like phosphoesterase domain-containing protein n=1 Tax=Manihot esculenta TaxID=3983 RepID=A0A2C9UX84_MANES|nr:uncharacterized protein C630.12 isoform X2 [Manihot esculenta]OAY36300.1 hypothetical protein MANES_11G010600v8 [Manihot esculenta]
MKQHHKLTLALCGIWAATILYGEMLAFWVPSLWSCSWPHLHHLPRSSANTMINGVGSGSDYVKVAVIADPQLMDRTSLRLPPKSFALETAQFYTDLYMRRAFFSSIRPFKPDVILFLGDYFDGGPFLSDQEWQESLHRFRHIFGMNTDGRYTDIQVYFIPGNHDIGYASINSHHPEVVRRYVERFGIRNFQFTVGKVEFIAVDAQTLDGRPRENLASVTWEFVKNVSTDIQLVPRVLLSHIPLYRRHDTYCGSYRSSPIINQAISYSALSGEIKYQNYVTEESSYKLLELVKPALILSGHDHDQCTVVHESNFGSITEHTLGTISWQQGNLYPSFMLLSVSNSATANVSIPEDLLISQLCFLPWQTHIYIWYISLFVLTLLTLLFWPTSGVSFGHHLSGLMECLRHYGSMFRGEKDKNEDENCEYEMMWDAEGAMHLVKKVVDTSISRTSDKASVERGNAVIRPTARKNISQEGEISMNLDINADVGNDPSIKLPSRISKSKTRIIIQRLMRTFRMVTVIAAVNVPIYMMLLFKDWIDQ